MLAPDAVVELVWQDETGSTAVTLLHAPSSLTVAEIASDAEALGAILASLTDAVLVRYRIKYRSVRETAVPATSDTPLTEAAVFVFSPGDELPMSVITVHSIKDSIMLTSGFGAGYIVDTSNTDVIAFKNAVIDNGLSNPFADDLITLVSAYRQSRL